MKQGNNAIRRILLIFFSANGAIALLVLGLLIDIKIRHPQALSTFLTIPYLIYFVSFFLFSISGLLFLKHFNPIETERSLSEGRIIDSPIEPEDVLPASRKWKNRLGIITLVFSLYLMLNTYFEMHEPAPVGSNISTWIYLFNLLLIFFYAFTIVCLWIYLAKAEKDESGENVNKQEAHPKEEPKITFKWK